MARYLDPKSDVVFKKIFGGHPHLLQHFLNAVLPFPDDQQIVSLEYLPAEQIPEIPAFKRTIVDVKCRDEKGNIFIVEMQVEWTNSFMREITNETDEVDPELLSIPEIQEAVTLAKQSAYTPQELESYESYWKAVSSERTLKYESEEKGRVEGEAAAQIKIAKRMKAQGISYEVISSCTQLSIKEIELL